MKTFIVIDCLEVAESTKCYEIKVDYSYLDMSCCVDATIYQSHNGRPSRINFKTVEERDKWLMINIIKGCIAVV